MLLGIDTASRLISIALYDGQQVLAEQTWQSYNNHTRQLAPAIFQMMESAEVEMSQITALAACTGPGSYTGLRIGVAMAKGLAAARRVPLVGLSSFEILAAGQPYYGGSSALITVVPAGRGRVIVKTYRWRKGQWSSGRSEPTLMSWDALLAQVDGPAYITGEIDEQGLARLTEAPQLTLIPAAHRLRRAGFLAQNAWELLQNTANRAIFAPARLTPLYVKTDDSPAEGVTPAQEES
ncbi:MAG: tRNA (adenosine(37)-N6)-threonylcarbamoyltransferase complex dimerization subunit type 1 TsaB [Anaerolineae bacterium]|jgi:tRNA threonylcarbamoyladenosine biosynthesis protein TsaB|nr:tRNA (adenosine(37)-N6)-threonylcarbamoyltransferase complex dimerization subunit type 1 TsaB [Anaerolineae bacterium]